MHLLRGKKVAVNGAKISSLPRRYGNHDVENENVFAIRLAGIFIIITWPRLGLTVMWDGSKKYIISNSRLRFYDTDVLLIMSGDSLIQFINRSIDTT